MKESIARAFVVVDAALAVFTVIGIFLQLIRMGNGGVSSGESAMVMIVVLPYIGFPALLFGLIAVLNVRSKQYTSALVFGALALPLWFVLFGIFVLSIFLR
jgi:hypothetical protein